jgi:prepilin signal peptidase PulO-like enzyme (type II secretory pathway)
MGIFFLLLAVGFFTAEIVNYLADVLPASGSLAHPICWNCGSAIPWKSQFLLRKCGVCGKSPHARAFIVLVAIPAATLYLWKVPAHQFEFPWTAILLAYLVLIAIVDIEHRLILHTTSVAGALMGLGIGLHLHGLWPTIVGGAVGYGIMLAFYGLGVVFVRYMSRRRGQAIDEVALGYGDVNLAGIAGLLLGWPGIVFGLLFTILAGGLASLGVIAIMLIGHRYRAYSAIPYGPFLVLSIILLLLRP